MKKYTWILLMTILPVMVNAQRHEIGILGGIKTDGGWTGSLAYYIKLGSVRLGPVVEASRVVEKNVFATFATGSYNAISPGVNVNYCIPITRGYVYPGITARYRIGSGALEYRGMDFGLQMGAVIKLVKSLSANVETGFRSANITASGITGYELGKTSVITVPITVGLRLAF